MEHEAGCKWEDFYVSLYLNNPYGADECLTISENMLIYEANTTKQVEGNVAINFKFCPCCGVEL